jgi:hypothetical protein
VDSIRAALEKGEIQFACSAPEEAGSEIETQS